MRATCPAQEYDYKFQVSKARCGTSGELHFEAFIRKELESIKQYSNYFTFRKQCDC
jgi:hypothetical protein